MSKDSYCISCGNFANLCECEIVAYTRGEYWYSKEAAVDLAMTLLTLPKITKSNK